MSTRIMSRLDHAQKLNVLLFYIDDPLSCSLESIRLVVCPGGLIPLHRRRAHEVLFSCPASGYYSEYSRGPQSIACIAGGLRVNCWH